MSQSKRPFVRRVQHVDVTPEMKPDDLPQYVRVKQAARYLQLSEWKIREEVRQGRIPNAGDKFGSKAIMIPREYFKANEVTA